MSPPDHPTFLLLVLLVPCRNSSEVTQERTGHLVKGRHLAPISLPPIKEGRVHFEVGPRRIGKGLVSQLEADMLQVWRGPVAVVQAGVQAIHSNDGVAVAGLKVPRAVAVHLAHTVVPRVLPVLLPGFRVESGGVGAGDVLQGSNIGAILRLQPASERIHSGLALANSPKERIEGILLIRDDPRHISQVRDFVTELHKVLWRVTQQINRQSQLLRARGKGPHAFEERPVRMQPGILVLRRVNDLSWNKPLA
mmetsp:Transcript_6137/g.15821  ORF Transcript_6137/g.15821 Transcript_6137/m.15821 type:complete len:251 (-) Transcript_6137:243-995(-)